VDNLANAKQTLSKPEANAKQMLPVSLDFASVHSHPQSSTLSLTLAEECARERAPARSEPKSAPEAGEVPSDNFSAWVGSLDQAEAAHKASLMSQEQGRKRNPEEQKQRVAKPRSMACHLTGEHLALARKQAGIGVAA
jgi:hypothetical protein